MSQRLDNIQVPLGGSLEEKLRLLSPHYTDYRILRKSIDARGRRPRWVYTVLVAGPGESLEAPEILLEKVAFPKRFRPPIVVGSGPAGLFAALRLVERGIPCLLIEQGEPAKDRMKTIARFWRYGELNSRTNVCFGEGGAGLYSDGKLITRIKSPHIPYVLDRLVQFGAPEEILWLANPHVGSDRIRKVIPVMREFLLQNGCEIRFRTKVVAPLCREGRVAGVELEDGTQLESDFIVLATGHSATDMFHQLKERGVAMEGKSFALGLRIEHPQKDIDRCQYGSASGHPELGAANYRLADHDRRTGIGVYSFCMCPGGYVIASTTDPGTVVSNGMSNYARNSPYANAAIVVSIDHETHFKSTFGGLEFRAQLEREAFLSVQKAGGTKEFPAQRVEDFLQRRLGSLVPSSSPSGVVPCRLDALLPEAIYERLSESLVRFNGKLRGFISPHALLHGIESRTSCPVRIPRDPVTLESTSHEGLYPSGEGAGYAGGITSAAVDGVRVAEAIATKITGQQ